MSQKILFDVKAEGGQWYGTLVISNIRAEGGKPLEVGQYLSVMLKSPSVSGFNASIQPWVEHNTEFKKQEFGSAFLVKAKVNFLARYKFNGKDSEILTFNIDGDMRKPKPIVESLILTADRVPYGTVNISCAAPDPALVGGQQTLTFVKGISTTVTLGTKPAVVPFQVPPYTYAVTATDATDKYHTVVATAQVQPAQINVPDKGEAALAVTYGQIKYYTAIDVTIGDIPRLQKEKLHVKVAPGPDFWSATNHTTPLRGLPPSGTFDVSVDPITLNNRHHSFKPKHIHAPPLYHHVEFPGHEDPIDTVGFVKLPIVVTTKLVLPANITVRLVGPKPASLIYTQEVPVKNGTYTLAVPVAPVEYTVQVPNIIHDYTVAVVKAPTTLKVKPDGSTTLPLKIVAGANLKVPGFPNFLSFGGVSNLDCNYFDDFLSAKASSVCKYAGNGEGNRDTFLPADPDTVSAIKFASDLGKVHPGKPVLPVIVSYTCNMSGGGTANLKKDEWLTHSFANLIVSLIDANKTMKTNPVPGVAYILNPDFLGECQKAIGPDDEAHVCGPLKAAVKYWHDEGEIPDIEVPKFDETVRGYVLAVNWLFRTILSTFKSESKLKVTFGWQVNLWGSQDKAGASWIYKEGDPYVKADEMAKYITSLGVFDSPNRPDFLVVDRYEADDFVIRGYTKGFCFGPHEWPRFFDFCRDLSEILVVPVMPWQIPSSHSPVTETVSDLEKEHWGTGGSYIFGDPKIGSDYHNIRPQILAIKFPPELPFMGTGVEAMFKKKTFDWTNSTYQDFPLRGIFAVVLGGGDTAGIVSSTPNVRPWVTDKLSAYMDHPIPLDHSASARK